MASKIKPVGSGKLPTEVLSAAFASGADSMGCPVPPNTDTDWRIPGSWSDAQVGHTIRDLTSKGYVLAVWVCNGELWVRPLNVSASTLAAQV
jgi:hypothetical protein